MELLQIKDENFWKKIGTASDKIKGGVYRLIAVKEGNPITINRFLGSDDNGLLYIGKASSYINRVIELKKSIDPDYDGTGHTCGIRYKSNPKIASQFLYEHLFIELLPTDEPEVLESKLLKEYFMKFGEAPPLNAIY